MYTIVAFVDHANCGKRAFLYMCATGGNILHTVAVYVSVAVSFHVFMFSAGWATTCCRIQHQNAVGIFQVNKNLVSKLQNCIT